MPPHVIEYANPCSAENSATLTRLSWLADVSANAIFPRLSVCVQCIIILYTLLHIELDALAHEHCSDT